MHDVPSMHRSGQAGAAAPRSRPGARASRPCRPEGTLHFWHEGILFVGRSIANKPHRHFTASLIFALRGSFRGRFGGSPWRSMRGVLVAPNLDQQLDARGCDLVICQIDPETNAYARLSGTLARRGPVWALPSELVAQLCAGTEETLARSGFRVSELWDFIIGHVNGHGREPLRLDARVARVLEMLKADLCARTTVGSLAAAVRLSPSRLVHLFNAQMGMSLRRYVLWLRMRQVVFSLALGRTLTDASHEAGFADSAHLCRTFRSMFGLSLSSLFRSSGVKFVVTPPEDPPAGPHGPYDRERWAAVSAERGRLCARAPHAASGAGAGVRS
jgi:AraC-like DNA-binding protein